MLQPLLQSAQPIIQAAQDGEHEAWTCGHSDSAYGALDTGAQEWGAGGVQQELSGQYPTCLGSACPAPSTSSPCCAAAAEPSHNATSAPVNLLCYYHFVRLRGGAGIRCMLLCALECGNLVRERRQAGPRLQIDCAPARRLELHSAHEGSPSLHMIN